MIDSPMALPLRVRRAKRLTLAACGMLVAGIATAASAPDTTQPILVLPPLRWNATGDAWTYATEQSAIGLARAMGQLTFGMTPEEVSQHLPGAGSALHWNDLPKANEYSEDVRYVWIPMGGAGALRAPVTSCLGDSSYIVLLFLNDALFRASWRFLPDAACPDPDAAAEQVYAAFVPIASNVAVSMLYHTGNAAVVDVTDPAAGPLIAIRWQMRGQ